MYESTIHDMSLILYTGHAGGEDEISFDPDDIIENIEQVWLFYMW